MEKTKVFKVETPPLVELLEPRPDGIAVQEKGVKINRHQDDGAADQVGELALLSVKAGRTQGGEKDRTVGIDKTQAHRMGVHVGAE